MRSFERIAQGLAEELDGDVSVVFVIVQRGPGVRKSQPKFPVATIDAECEEAPKTMRAAV